MIMITLGYQISIGVLLYSRVSLRLRCNVLRYPLTNDGLIAHCVDRGIAENRESLNTERDFMRVGAARI